MVRRVFKRGWQLVVSTRVVAALSACGGGGGRGDDGSGGGDAALREPLPTLVQDIVPTGDRLDLRDHHDFPAQAGDRWTCDLVRNGVTTAGAASLSVTSSTGDDAWLSETVQGGTTTGHWRRSADGIVAVAVMQRWHAGSRGRTGGRPAGVSRAV